MLCFASPEVLQERSELLAHWEVKVTVMEVKVTATEVSQGGATFSSLGNQRKRRPQRQDQRISLGRSRCCPLLPWLRVPWGPLEFRRKLGFMLGKGRGHTLD